MRAEGDPVLLRFFNAGRVSWAKPVSVVFDSADGVGLFLREGTPIKRRCLLDGSPVPRGLPYGERFRLPWLAGDGLWERTNVLMLTPAQAAHSYWGFWDAVWSFGGWYVNLQAPLRRTALGFDTSDHVLDIVVEPDLSAWAWKDEHELVEAVDAGRFTPVEAAELYREGERAMAALQARSWPFDRDWSSWRQDPAWPVPVLPEGWDVV